MPSLSVLDLMNAEAMRVTSPLLTRKIITQITTANAYYAAVASGAPTDGLQAAKSVGYGVGLAIGLFAMQTIGSLIIYQSTQRAAVIGCKLRAAVSICLCDKLFTHWCIVRGPHLAQVHVSHSRHESYEAYPRSCRKGGCPARRDLR